MSNDRIKASIKGREDEDDERTFETDSIIRRIASFFSSFLVVWEKIKSANEVVIGEVDDDLLVEDVEDPNIKIIFLGLAYKPNVPDFRNSKAIEIYEYFKKIDKDVKAYDPYLKKNNRQYLTEKEYQKYSKKADLIIKLVNHNYFNNKKFNNTLSINRLLS